MNAIGNLIWLIFGGFFSALGYFIMGFVFCITIIGIPFGIQCFKIGMLVLLPFGKRIVTTSSSGGCLTLLFNIIVLFYIQSVLIGVFNFFDMLTIKQFAEGDFKLNTQSVATKAQSKNGCGASFFLMHYGFFHLVYLFFLVTLVNIKQLDFRFIEFSFFIILATCISGFVQNKIRNRNEDVNITAMFFMPYARIIPMHLMIL